MRLSGEFVSGKVIAFAVGYCGGLMGVGRKVVEFCDSIVRARRHSALLIVFCAAMEWPRSGLDSV